MNKIVPFSKEIIFDNEIGEITSIALEDNLSFLDEYTISGNFNIHGTNFKEIEDDFNYDLPVDIQIDTKYDTSKCKISIDDFYYETNDNILNIKIDVLLENLEYQERKIDIDASFKKDDDELKIDFNLEKKKEEIKEKEIKQENNTIDLFKEMDDEKTYSIYRVYRVNNDDTIESILEKYHISHELLGEYNDLTSIKTGDKLIIPSVDE